MAALVFFGMTRSTKRAIWGMASPPGYSNMWTVSEIIRQILGFVRILHCRELGISFSRSTLHKNLAHGSGLIQNMPVHIPVSKEFS